jgi:hypothetical protein
MGSTPPDGKGARLQARCEFLKGAGSAASCEIVPGRDHFSLPAAYETYPKGWSTAWDRRCSARSRRRGDNGGLTQRHRDTARRERPRARWLGGASFRKRARVGDRFAARAQGVRQVECEAGSHAQGMGAGAGMWTGRSRTRRVIGSAASVPGKHQRAIRDEPFAIQQLTKGAREGPPERADAKRKMSGSLRRGFRRPPA